MPASVSETIAAVKQAITDNKLSWDDINKKVRKVLLAKYNLGLNESKPINTNNLLADLNAKTDDIRYEVAIRSLTMLRNETTSLPSITGKKIAYIGIGTSTLNDFGKRIKEDLDADTYLFSYNGSAKDVEKIIAAVKKGKYAYVVVGIHDYSLRPANNYGISSAAINLYTRLQPYHAYNYVFGNVLALSNFCKAKNLVACHQDDDITQKAAADLLEGKIVSMGRLPVSVCGFKYGAGIVHGGIKPAKTSLSPKDILNSIDSIATDAIRQKAFPGCVILAAHKGSIIYYKAFGNYTYEPSSAMTPESIFDLASVTKTSATTLAVMKLYEQGKLDIKKKLGDYLPWVKGTNKANLLLSDILMHQAGLVPFIRFYQETIDPTTGIFYPGIYSPVDTPGFSVRVASNLYLRNDWEDTIMKRIVKSPLGRRNKYVYSDNDFIFLGKIVEQLTKMPLDKYVQQTFYDRMGLTTTGFKPLARFEVNKIVPTEQDHEFRQQLLVHDEGAAFLGGVAGHCGFIFLMRMI
ncbi:MAG: serine hydrolase [Chitinophagaceae bacterium]